ncbi:MAG: HAD hydrolase family protein [Candidatus Bathyarchaeota archaeon]|nr:MAG: HAD hydrolase family protein [Candidatus Bathyarchaeota archaeon]
MPPIRRTFVSDCEGPISKNDNAFEIAKHFLPGGEYFFTLVSKYDDVLADIVKRPGYKAGYTLKLITPFLKAFDVTNAKVKEFSTRNLILLARAKETLQRIREMMTSFIVSTSYEQYISSLCRAIGFPFENVYCTKLNLDQYSAEKGEVEKIQNMMKEISALPMIEIPKNAKSINELTTKSRHVVNTLDRIFWKSIPQMTIGRMLAEIKPIGSGEKADSLKDIIRRVGCDLSDVMYIGDSITDVQAFQLVRNNGGITVSFNGNEYAIRNAEIAVLSNDTMITAVLADVFYRHGRRTVYQLVREWDHHNLEKYCTTKTLKTMRFATQPTGIPYITLVTPANINQLIEKSSRFRRSVRGEAIGRLG